MDKVKLGLIQMNMTSSLEENLCLAEKLVREAASLGAQIILLPELFENLYFCQVESEEYSLLANPLENHPFLHRFQKLAQELQVVLPVSYFEKANQVEFNSLVCIDADGTILGNYRKSHIPDGPGYEEKFYFKAGDTGFQVWYTKYAAIGVGICWDQWFPETARCLMLKGAELLLFPTAIGTEPESVQSPNNHRMWQRAMQGHAVSNSVYVAASNRVGTEIVKFSDKEYTQTYYGHTFVTDYRGEVIAELNQEVGILVQEIDIKTSNIFRRGMGFFRDRRKELYNDICV